MGEASKKPSDPLCGAILDGRYRVGEVVGTGGMGVVYRAEQVSAHGRDVAIKVLSSAALSTSTVQHRFETESRIIAQLRHPNTLKMIDSGRFPDGRLYIVTEFLSGYPLAAVQDSLPSDPVRVLRIVRQVCGSLAEAHGMGIVHRDLKPSNIFIEAVAGQEIVKVLDFGLAKLIEVPGVTLPARICGTPGFMSPEQITGQSVDPRSDIYSLGAILYECICGAPPFVAPDVNNLLMKHVLERPRALSALDLDIAIDPELDQLVSNMLAKEPYQRPGSVDVVRETLERIELRVLSAPPPTPQFSDRTTIDRLDENDEVDTSPSRVIPFPKDLFSPTPPSDPQVPIEAAKTDPAAALAALHAGGEAETAPALKLPSDLAQTVRDPTSFGFDPKEAALAEARPAPIIENARTDPHLPKAMPPSALEAETDRYQLLEPPTPLKSEPSPAPVSPPEKKPHSEPSQARIAGIRKRRREENRQSLLLILAAGAAVAAVLALLWAWLAPR